MWQAKAGTDYARWRAVFAVNGVLARCGRNKLLFDEQWSSQVFVPFLAVRRRNSYPRGALKMGDFVIFAGINYLAVVIAAVLAFAASSGWYMSLSRRYAAALGKSVQQMAEERKKPGAFLPYIYALVGNLIIGWMLAGLLGHLGAGQVTLRNGIISAAFIWFGFILTTMTVNFSFSGRDKRLLAIDAGNWLIVLLVIGAVIGAMGV
jgi:Protein of unknown function (DUF1761)